MLPFTNIMTIEKLIQPHKETQLDNQLTGIKSENIILSIRRVTNKRQTTFTHY